MPQVFTDLAGQTFGRLTAIARHPCKGIVRWDCKCSCGATAVVPSVALKNGYTRSCGCLRRETSKARAQARSRRGGLTNSKRLGAAWREADAPASKKAYVPVKRWHGAANALGVLAAILQSADMAQVSALRIRGITTNLCLEAPDE